MFIYNLILTSYYNIYNIKDKYIRNISNITLQEFKEVCRNLNKEQIEAAFKRFDQTGNLKKIIPAIF